MSEFGIAKPLRVAARSPRGRLLLTCVMLLLASCGGNAGQDASHPRAWAGSRSAAGSPVGPGLAGQHPDAPTEGETREVLGTDPGAILLTRLDDLHKLMLRGGLPLQQVTLVATEMRGNDVVLHVDTATPVWSPPGDSVSVEVPKLLSVPDVPRELLNQIAVDPPSRGLVVVDLAGSVLALALETADGSSLAGSGTSEGPLFLADAGIWLYQHHFDPMPMLDPCRPPSAAVAASTPQRAVIGYFETLKGTPRSAIEETIIEINEGVEAILRRAPTFIDPVTGDAVLPSANDISNQLRDGVAPEDVVLRPAIPVGVIVPPDRPADDVVVFLEYPSGAFLGAIELQPVIEYDAGGSPSPNYSRVLFVTPPEPGSSVAVYERSLSEADFVCPPPDGRQPLILIPYDDFAGSNRALVDPAAGSYSEFSAP